MPNSMIGRTRKPRVAVVSPFLDKRHGTERHVCEQIERLAEEFNFTVYSQSVEDVNAAITWHRIPKLPGPHLLNYLWWFFANRLWREWDRRFRGVRYDLVFSPGVNCLDADVIAVHIVFAEYAARNRESMGLGRNPIRAWPRLMHRNLYYGLIAAFERRIYRRGENVLAPVSARIARALGRIYGRTDRLSVIYAGLDHKVFNAPRRQQLRSAVRSELGISAERFIVLLIGNNWRNKGLAALLRALTYLDDLPVDLLYVTEEADSELNSLAIGQSLAPRVRWLRPRADAEFFYAAADLYAGVSLEDPFAMPPLEAMACGLPVVVSSSMGVSELISNGVNGFILSDPNDAPGLAAIIGKLFRNSEYRESIACAGAQTAGQYSWERNARELGAIFNEVLSRKGRAIQREMAVAGR